MKSKRAREAAAPVEDEKPADIHATAAGDEQPAKKRKRTDDGADADAAKKSKDKKDKKDKKEKKDKSKYSKESRKEKKEKRKDLQDLPEDDGDDAETEAAAAAAAEVKAEKKAEKKASKKDKKNEEKKTEQNGDSTPAAAAAAETSEPKSESKKSKKNKDKKKNAAEAPATSTENAATAVPAGASNGIDLDVEGGDKAGANGKADGGKDKADRHIVFVGNLPYSATAASISAHFASLSPVAVRCLTNKGADTKNTCRGIAFVEFANVWSQRTCLDKFHHSTFEDGISAARKINVELTAGGGGKTQHRQDKIRDKNIKLDENRAKRIEKEKNTKTETAANGSASQEQQSAMEDAIHPSRRARVPGNRW